MNNLGLLAEELAAFADDMRAQLVKAGRDPETNRHHVRARHLATAAQAIARGDGDKARIMLRQMSGDDDAI